MYLSPCLCTNRRRYYSLSQFAATKLACGKAFDSFNDVYRGLRLRLQDKGRLPIHGILWDIVVSTSKFWGMSIDLIHVFHVEK